MPLSSQLPAALANSLLVRFMSSVVAAPVFCVCSAVFLMSSAVIVARLLCGCVSGPFSGKRCDCLPAALVFPCVLFLDWLAPLCAPFANFFFFLWVVIFS